MSYGAGYNRGAYRGGFRGNWSSSRRGSSSGYKSNAYAGNVSVPGYQTPPQHGEMDFLTPDSSPFIGSISSTSELQVLRQRELEMCPFESWDMYLPCTSYESGSDVERLVTSFLRFFSEFYSSDQFERIKAERLIALDYNDLIYDPDLTSEVPLIAEYIRDDPEQTLGAIGLAIDQIIFNKYSDSISSKDRAASPLPVQLYNVSPTIPLNSLRSSQYGKCVSVRGTVLSVTNIRPHIARMAFFCSSCRGIQVLHFLEGKYRAPTKCLARGCRAKSFLPMKTSPLTQSLGWQGIRLQELRTAGDARESCRVERSVECELTGALVDSCVPGDVVTIAAVVKASSGDQASTKERSKNLIYLRAISILRSTVGKEGLSSLLSENELSAVLELQKAPSLFRLLTNSLCPSLYGHELVKAGLLLGLFGGVSKQEDGEVLIRGESHVLLVGDPGQGKGQLLQAVSALAPRGVFVSGSSATVSELTVTLTKEAGGSGDYALEAGALVLGDCGVCCIDEFEKMNSQHQALLEAMEQQHIRLAKSAIVCSLPARTSIVAAANPVGGHYNRAKTMSENLKMSSFLLSRFDLIFILFDKPDEEMDHKLSERIMSKHTGKKKKSLNASICESIFDVSDVSQQLSLADKLKYKNGEEFQPIPPHLIKKFIAYARNSVSPRLSPEAALVLKRFYAELRAFMSGSPSSPITTRSLEALIRLTEARARSELRDIATEEDAVDVIGILKFSLIDTFSDEMGCIKHPRSVHTSGLSQRNQVKALIAELTRMSEIRDCSLFSIDEIREVSSYIGIPTLRFEDVFYSLSNQCYLLKKGPMLYELQTQSCL